MLCQWGDIIFEAGQITAVSSSGGPKYAEHELLGAKPRLQYVGEELRSYGISFSLHYLRQGVDSLREPQTVAAQLQKAVDSHKPYDFMWGGEPQGQFVGESLSITKDMVSSAGVLLAASGTLTLKEAAANVTAAAPPSVSANGKTAANTSKVTGQEKPSGKADSAKSVVRQP